MALLEILSTITGLIEAFAGLYILYLALYRFWTVPWSGKELRETTGTPHLAGAIGQAAWGWAGDLAKKIPGAGDAWTKHVEQEVRTLPQRKMEIMKLLAALQAQVNTAIHFDETILNLKNNWKYDKKTGNTAVDFKNQITKVFINALSAADLRTIKLDDVKADLDKLAEEAKELSTFTAFTSKAGKPIITQINLIVAKGKDVPTTLKNFAEVAARILKDAQTVYDKETNDGQDAGIKLLNTYSNTKKNIIENLSAYDKLLTQTIDSINKL